jgi:hypothetical protein
MFMLEVEKKGFACDSTSTSTCSLVLVLVAQGFQHSLLKMQN